MTESALFRPFELGDLQLKNRVALAPMTRARAGKERLANALMAEYYAQRSGASLIITEATTISEQANGWNESPGIYSDAMMESWKPVVDAVHAEASVVFMQLWHCGRASHSSFHPGKPAVAPSAIAINGEYIHTPVGKQPYEVPHALTKAEIAATIDDYRQAAMRAKQAGFDGVEIHSANGYLLDTFLQSRTNHRTDEYGGSIENRTRLLREVIEAVATVWPMNRIAVRFSPNGNFNDMGSTDYREQFTFATKLLAPLGLAYLHVCDGLAFGFHGLGEPMTIQEFREHFNGPLMANCGYTQAAAEQVIEEGAADLVSFGRPFISNPDLVERFRNGWPLASESSVASWYSSTGAEGYTDFPAYSA